MRLPEAVDAALARLHETPDMNLLEGLHEQGLSTEEAVVLVREVVAATTSKHDAAGIGVYLGILIGRGLAS